VAAVQGTSNKKNCCDVAKILVAGQVGQAEHLVKMGDGEPLEILISYRLKREKKPR
jgi:hypothetical protein